MKKLDLCFQGNLEKDDKILFNKLAAKKITEFNNFTDELSKRNLNNKYWWYNCISSRDSLVTPFFFYFISINLLLEKNKDLEHYFGERGRRGRRLPRGFQRVDRLDCSTKAD